MTKKFSTTGWLVATVVAFVFAIVSISSPSHARDPRKTHVVKTGDSVAKIADFYGVSQRDLMEMNSLKKGRGLRLGQKLKIPNVLRVSGKKYKVKKGDSLASLAVKFKRSRREIANANKLKMNSTLTAGRTIVIPDKGAGRSDIKVKGREIKPILFLRVRTGERLRVRLYSRKGKLLKGNVRKLSRLSRDKIDGKVKRLNTRLIQMIQRVAEQFPGKPIEIISGYRAHQAGGNESQHAFGRALDFRIPGTPTKQIYRFCKSLPRSGCGYYPQSGFVHMDAREKSTTWVE